MASISWKGERDLERKRDARQRTCTLAVIQVSVGGRIRGEPGAARAFCGIDYSLLSRCTSRVKSTPLPASTLLPPFPISSSPSNDPLPASTLYLISTLLFFFSFPPFCPVSLLTVTSCWHISFPASWLTCEPSRITGEQSH